MEWEKNPKYVWKSLSFIKEPQNGFSVYKDKYWVSKNNEVLFFNFYGTLVPQCNSNKAAIENLYPGTEPIFVPIAYVDTGSWK